MNADRIIRNFSKNYLADTFDVPISPAEIDVLKIIVNSKEPLTPEDAAKQLEISKSMAIAHIILLRSKGYVHKEIFDSYQNSDYALPTDTGVKHINDIELLIIDKLANIESELGSNSFDELISLLNNLNKALCHNS